MRILKFKEFTSLLEDLSASLDKLNTVVNTAKNADAKIQDNVVKKLEDTTEYVEKVSHIANIHEVFVNQKGFSEPDFEKLKVIIQKDTEESLIALDGYLKNPKDITYFESFNDKVNLPSKLSSETGISEKTLSQLFSIEGNMKAGKGVGRGEVFLGLMIKDAKNSAKGDVNVNGIMYEVKGADARLNTTNGFGQGRTSILSFLKALESISPELSNYTKSKPDDWNFSFKRKKSLLFDLFKDAVKLGVLDEVISAIVSNIFVTEYGIWQKAKVNDQVGNLVTSAFNNHVNKRTGDIDMDSLNYALLYANTVYYQSLEKFHAFFLINPSDGSFAIFNPQTQNENWLKANTKYQQPSFGDAPTSMCYKIAI
jgi:hypothetical protein